MAPAPPCRQYASLQPQQPDVPAEMSLHGALLHVLPVLLSDEDAGGGEAARRGRESENGGQCAREVWGDFLKI